MSLYEESPNSSDAKKSSKHGNLILDTGSQRLIELTARLPDQRSPEAVQEILSILHRKAPKLLDGLADYNKVAIAKQCELKLYKNGEIVFHQGDVPDAYYTVIRGAVSIYALNSSCLAKGDEVTSGDEDSLANASGREHYGIFLLQLSPGESFGELSFNDGCHTRRNATVISDGSHGQARITETAPTLNNSSYTQAEMEASDVSVLLLIHERVYMSEMFARHSAKHQTSEKISFLKESSLFKHWTMDQLVKMAYAMKKKQYNKGSEVIRQSERMEYVWIIRDGVVRIRHRLHSNQGMQSMKKSLSRVNEKERSSEPLIVDIADLGPTDCIGLVESMDENVKKSQREAITLVATDFYFLPLSFFKSMISQDAKTFAMIEKVVDARKKWESLRKDYALKFPTMAMSLPKDAALMSNYQQVYYDPSALKSERNRGGNASKEYQANDGLSSGTGRRNGDRQGRLDGLTRKNREVTLDLLVADAGL